MAADKIPDYGTKQTGYVPAKDGPFECERCSHFIASVKGCVHPEVMGDPEVPQEKGKLRYAKVEPKACCSEWYPADKA